MKNLTFCGLMLLSEQNELLLVRKKGSEYFQLPGGKPEKDEKNIDTVIREVQEELGLTLLPEEITYLGEHTTIAVNEKDTCIHGHIFQACFHDQQELSPKQEIEEMRWVHKSDYQQIKIAHLAEEFVLPVWLAE